MSEKFNTDELVTELRDIVNCANQLEGKERFVLANEESFHAIIAKLRAGDKLCEAAKVTLDYLDDHFWENANIDESMAGERILTPLEKELKKAIADYEGKK